MDPSLVRIIGSTGKEGKGENQFTQPRGICIDAITKEIFVVDCNNHRIQVYHLNSLAYIRQIGKGVQGDSPGSLNYAVGICMDDTNQIYVADTNNHRIVVFNRITGGHIRNISSHGTAPGLLCSPYGVCVDIYDDILYIADYDNHRVQAFNKNSGEFIRTIGLGFGSGDGQMNQPIVICIDYEFDHLLVADYSNNRIIVFDKESGSFLRNIGTNAGTNNLAGPRGLCISKEANILFVADRENHRIQLYDKATYAFLRSVGSGPGLNPGQFQRPMEICVNIEEGVLLVVDGYNHRVQILEIPELQVEKRRLKAAAQSKAEAELKGKSIPKPSLLAVTTQFTGNERVSVDPRSGGLRISFEGMGPLFDLFLPQHDVSLLLAHSASISTRTSTQFLEDSIMTSECASSDNVAAESPLIQRQAELFLSILDDLCPQEKVAQQGVSEVMQGSDAERPSYVLAAPALFALHSLLHRGWTPSQLPSRVITLLVGFLANISSGIVGESERAKVLEAVVSLLRSAIIASPDSLTVVLATVLDKLEAPVRYQLQPTTERGTTTAVETETDHISVLMAYFELLGHIFVQADESTSYVRSSLLSPPKLLGPRGSVSPLMSHSISGLAFGLEQPPPSAATYHERRRKSSQQRSEILQFVFGTTFMSALTDLNKNRNGLMPKEMKNIPHSTSAASLPPSSPNTIDPPEEIMPPPLEPHPAFAADPRILSRAAAETTSARNNASKNSADVAQEISVPKELCALISTVFRLRQRRKAHSSVSLAEFCSQRSEQTFASSDLSSPSAAKIAPPPPLQQQDVPMHALQLQLFQSAASYLQRLRTDEDVKPLNVGDTYNAAKQTHRSRGGRNIWRAGEPFAAGDLLDAQDKEKCWFESIVQEVHADGSVKVHFMGWGSKWDDLVASTELSTRLAPLNEKTKNWRADLFKGGLIEIKCNDDPINQKWMWGKITALNTDEAWVEVSYLFSNEPTVVKRAWLFGETICPVGMHTKDKSKAAAALLVRPPKKVDEIIKEKASDSALDDEFMFFDRSDDFEDLSYTESEDFENSNGNSSIVTSTGAVDCGRDESPNRQSNNFPYTTSQSGASTPFSRLRAFSTSARNLGVLLKTASADPLQHVSVVGLNIMECLMSELLNVTMDSDIIHGSAKISMIHEEAPVLSSASRESVHGGESSATRQYLLDTALNLIAIIAATPYRRLLVPYFTRVAIFHSGMRAKLVSGGVLTAKITSILLSGMRDFDPILQVLDHFKELSGRYCQVMDLALGASLSASALFEVTSRISATVDRCGVTQISNDLIEFILAQENLRYELFSHFAGSDRFGERSSKLRKILSYLFKTASRAESVKFQALFEGALMKRELECLDFEPRFDSRGTVCSSWAMSLSGALTSLYEKAQSVSRLEMLHIPQCHLAAERALIREFSGLTSEQLAGVAAALAVSLDCLLDPSFQRHELPMKKIAAMNSILAFQKVVMNEEMLHHFSPRFESLLAHRLLAGSYTSISAERSVLDELPSLPAAQKLLRDVSHTSVLNPDFSKYLMARLDADEIEYTPVLGLVLQHRQISIQVLCHHTWSRYTRCELYANLRLPAPMKTLQAHFDEFYTATAKSLKGSCSRRLTWCHGAGQVMLTFHQRNGGRVDLCVNEAQAAVLWAFNAGPEKKTTTVSDLCGIVNLSLEELRGVLASLADEFHPLPLISLSNSGEVGLSTVCSLSKGLLDGDFAESSYGMVDPAVADVEPALDYCTATLRHTRTADVSAVGAWRNEQIDACIVRVLKADARSKAADSDVRSGPELVQLVSAELLKRGQRRNRVFSEDEILSRADYLASMAYIDKVDLSVARGGNTTIEAAESTGLGVAVGYSYLQSNSEPIASNNSQLNLIVGEPLFLSLVEMVDAAAISEPQVQGKVDLGGGDQNDSGEGEEGKGDCGESKRTEFLAPSPAFVPASTSSQSEEARLLVAPAERQLTVDQLLLGIVNWTSSVRPLRKAKPTSAATGDLPTATPQKLPQAGSVPTTTPPSTFRPERRVPNWFGSPGASPLRFSDSAKSSSGKGGSESKSGHERTSLYRAPNSLETALSARGLRYPSSAGTTPPRPPPPPSTLPLIGSAQLSFPGFFEGVPPSKVKTFVSYASTQLRVINERVYATLGETVSQINKLLYQQSLGKLDSSVRSEVGHFPPPSIQSYLDRIGAALAVDVRDLNDYSELHRELFFALPEELTSKVCRKFNSLLEHPVDSLRTGSSAANLWIKRYPLLSELNASAECAGERDSEDAKQPPPASYKLSLYEYVFSTFACSHPNSSDSFSMEHIDLKNRSSSDAGVASEIGARLSNSSTRHDKRGMRTRQRPASAASPNQSRPGRGSGSGPGSGSALFGAAPPSASTSPPNLLFSGRTAGSRLSGISFGSAASTNPAPASRDYAALFLTDLEYRRREGIPDLILADNLNSDDSSRSSSRSNSNGDFSVAQLMHSIEAELRADHDSSEERLSPSPSLAFADIYASDRKGEEDSPPRSQASRSLLAPLPAGFLFQPERSIFMPPQADAACGLVKMAGETACKESCNNAASSISDACTRSSNSVSSTEDVISESLQDILRAYYRAFRKHIYATFEDVGFESCSDAPLQQSALTSIVKVLLQGAAQRIVDVAQRDAAHQQCDLWFLRDNDVASLDGIVAAAVRFLHDDVPVKDDMSYNETVSLNMFASPSLSVQDLQIFSVQHQTKEDDFYTKLLVDATTPEFSLDASSGGVVQQQSFLQFLHTASAAFEIPLAKILPQLAQYGWDLRRWADDVFACPSDPSEGLQDSSRGRSFVKLSECAPDLFARGVSPKPTGASLEGPIDTTRCEACETITPSAQLFALRCRHFACETCWEKHIEHTAMCGGGHISCIACAPPLRGTPRHTSNRVSLQKCVERGDVDLLLAVCKPEFLGNFLANKNRIYAQDYSSCIQHKQNDKFGHLAALLRLPQGDCFTLSKAGHLSGALNSIESAAVPASAAHATPLPAYHSTLTTNSSPARVSRLPPSHVRSPASFVATLRAAGTPELLPARASPRRAEHDVSAVPRNFTGLSPFHVPRASTSSPGIGIDASAGPWISDKSEGQTSRYLLETNTFMIERAQALQRQRKHTQNPELFWFVCNQLDVLAQYLRALSFLEAIEEMLSSLDRSTAKLWQHSTDEAIESLKDLLIVTNIKIRSKWLTAEGLTEAVTKDAVSGLRQRMERLIAHLQFPIVTRRFPRFPCALPSSVNISSASLVLCSSLKTTRTESVSSVFDLLPTVVAPQFAFGSSLGCDILSRGIDSDHRASKPTASDKFSDCRQLIERLEGHAEMSQGVLVGHLKDLDALLVAGFQTVLFANNICPVLVDIFKSNVEHVSVCHVVLALMEKMCRLNGPCAATLVELGAWACWALLITKRRSDCGVIATCCALMTNLLRSSGELDKAALELFDEQRGFEQLILVLHAHQAEFSVCQLVHDALLHSVDKHISAASSFMITGMCEVLIASLVHFSSFPSVKLQLVTLLERLGSNNKFMQEQLLGLNVFEHVIEIINEHAALDPNLLRQACSAASALSSGYHAGQTKFATMGGCRAMCHALRVSQDLTALTAVMRTISTLALRNSYVQDFLQLESAVDLLLAKKDEITALSTRSESFETKSKANLLLLSLDFALDTVRIPASRHSASHDLTAIAAIAGMRRAGGRVHRASTSSSSTSSPSSLAGIRRALDDLSGPDV